MVDAYTVDETLGEPAGHFGVAGVEHGTVLLAQPGQRGDREEAAIAADTVAPAHQPVVLAVVHLGAGAARSIGGDRQRQAPQPQQVAVDFQVGDVVVGTQQRQHDSALRVQVPVDVEERRVVRRAAVPQDVPPPRVLLGLVDAHVVGHDVDDHAQAACAGRRRQPRQALGATQLRRHRRRVGDVISMRRPGDRGDDGRQIEMRHPEVVEVVQQVFGVGEGEAEPARGTAQL